jgi:hypothetical protein
MKEYTEKLQGIHILITQSKDSKGFSPTEILPISRFFMSWLLALFIGCNQIHLFSNFLHM